MGLFTSSKVNDLEVYIKKSLINGQGFIVTTIIYILKVVDLEVRVCLHKKQSPIDGVEVCVHPTRSLTCGVAVCLHSGKNNNRELQHLCMTAYTYTNTTADEARRFIDADTGRSCLPHVQTESDVRLGSTSNYIVLLIDYQSPRSDVAYKGCFTMKTKCF